MNDEDEPFGCKQKFVFQIRAGRSIEYQLVINRAATKSKNINSAASEGSSLRPRRLIFFLSIARWEMNSRKAEKKDIFLNN